MDTFEIILIDIARSLIPFKQALSSPENFYSFMLDLGWEPEEIPVPLRNLENGLNVLLSELQSVLGGGISLDGSLTIQPDSVSGSISVAGISRIQSAVEQIVRGIREISNASDAAIPVKLRNDNFKTIFPRQLLDYLIINYLNSYQSQLAFFLRSVGVVKIQYLSPGGNRKPYMHYSINFSDIPDIFANPKRILENTFAWGSNNFAYGEFLYQVENLLMSLDIDVCIDNVQGVVINRLEQTAELDNSTIRKVLRGVFFERYRSGGRLAAEVRLVGLRGDATKKPGFAIMPAFNGLLDVKMNLGSDIAVKIGSQLNLQGGVGLIIRPDRPVAILTGFNQANTATSASGRITVVVERSNFDNTPTVIIGSSSGTRLEYRKIAGTGGVSLDNQNRVDIFAEFEIKGLKFVLKPEGDGFIRKLLPENGIDLETNLILGISYLHGFYFQGSAALEINIPIHIQLGVIELQGLMIAVKPGQQQLPVELGATFKGDLGPLKAVVENIGLRASFSFPPNGGNLGLIDLNLGFKPPNGVGLSIDAGVVKGGGFLGFYPDREEYAGALELVFSGFLNLKAIGLITTKLPDGSKGFSLLIIITAEFATGIQLSYGFTLLAVGGLLGLNRTMRLQPLAEGVRTGAINSILFPKDIIANAPRIISDLRTIFPPEEGKFLISPMAKLGWGTPTLISLSLGIIIEIPGNIAILGVLRVALPTDDLPLILMQVNFIGAIEFDKKRIWFFASLFESRYLYMTFEGEMGVLVAFGDDANFVVSVGGFHPQFNPPPLPFPNPARISVNYINESFARIRVMNYFAVTSNSAQIGAHAELFFGFDEFSVEGHIGYDALLQFSPFNFIIEVSASVALKAFGVGVFGISLRFSLGGPNPFRARGTGSITLFFVPISADFDITWGESRNTTLPPIEVMPRLKAEFEKLDNWKASLPAGNNLLVSLRKLEPAADTLVLHPVGVLRISQKAVPLDLPIDKVGNQKTSDAKRISVNVSTGGLGKKGDTFELFAIAQFQDMEDASKLSRPAYEPQHGGLELSVQGQQLASSRAVKRIVRYEEIIIDNNFKRFVRRFSIFVGVLFNHFLGGASVSQSTLSQSYQQKLQPFTEKIAVKPDGYSVAFQSTNKVVSTQANFVSQASAHDYMQRQIVQDPSLSDSLHVIPTHEVPV